jgi:hypothetical protein
MFNSATDSFAERLCKLERENRVLRRVFTVVLVGGLLLTIGGSNPPNEVGKTVEAERFVVRDAKGKERLRIGTEQEGSMASIVFLDEGGKEVTKLFLNQANKSSALSFMTPDGTSETVLYMKEDGSSYLTVQKAQHVRFSLGMGNKDAGPAIYILDEKGNVQFRAPMPGG